MGGRSGQKEIFRSSKRKELTHECDLGHCEIDILTVFFKHGLPEADCRALLLYLFVARLKTLRGFVWPNFHVPTTGTRERFSPNTNVTSVINLWLIRSHRVTGDKYTEAEMPFVYTFEPLCP